MLTRRRHVRPTRRPRRIGGDGEMLCQCLALRPQAESKLAPVAWRIRLLVAASTCTIGLLCGVVAAHAGH